MDQEEADRRELNSMLDELEQRQLYCNREQMKDGFGFFSPLSQDAGARSLTLLAGYTGQEVAEHLATVTVWNDHSAGTPS